MIGQLKQVCATLRTRVQIPRTHAKLHVEVCTWNLSAPGVRWEMETGDSLGVEDQLACGTQKQQAPYQGNSENGHLRLFSDLHIYAMAHTCLYSHRAHTHTHIHILHTRYSHERTHT